MPDALTSQSHLATADKLKFWSSLIAETLFYTRGCVCMDGCGYAPSRQVYTTACSDMHMESNGTEWNRTGMVWRGEGGSR